MSHRTVYTLACPTCCKGWKSTEPHGSCGCGRKVEARGQYVEIDLGRNQTSGLGRNSPSRNEAPE